MEGTTSSSKHPSITQPTRNPMIETTLRKIGLTDGEIKVYTSLLEIGSATSGMITKRCGISGSKVYEVIDRLIAKGLASSITTNGVKHFDAASPDKILAYLDQQKSDIDLEKQEIQQIIPQLILKQQTAAKSKARAYTGFEGIKTVNEEIISRLKKGDEWLSMGLTEQPKSLEIYFNKQQVIRARKGIIVKHLLNEQYRSLYTQRKHLPHTFVRFLPRRLSMPTSIDVFGDSVAIMILLKEDPMAIVIDSKHVAESFRKYFYIMWEDAKKPGITKVL